MPANWTLFDAIAAILLVYLVRRLLVARRTVQSSSPGPRGWPIVGNIFDMPASHQCETFAKWGEEWGAHSFSRICMPRRPLRAHGLPNTGDIVSITLFGRRTAILNSLDSANELLDKTGAIYSDRPVLPVSGIIVVCNRFVVLQPYGRDHKAMRRLVSQTVGTHDSHVLGAH